jgi:radical SAM superfamily enzyme YgiQ (UPF0313 family)
MIKSQALLASPRLLERTYPGKPMALDYLRAVLCKAGWDVATIDVDVTGLEAYSTALLALQPDLVGISSMSIQVDEANELAHLVRQLVPEAVLLRGGAHDTYAYEESCLTHRDLYDAYVVGEGEETLQDIANAIQSRSFLQQRSSIKGIAFWDGEPVFTGRRHSVNVNRYIPLRSNHHPSYDFGVFGYRKTTQMMAARGCLNACFYCSESVDFHGRRELRRGIESVRLELAQIKQAGYEAIYFDDPTFTRDRDWVLAMCEELRSWGFIWGCNTRVDCLDDDLIMHMRSAGCEYLFCGFESAVPAILAAMNKTPKPGEYLEAAVRAYSSLKRNGLPCSAFLIFGCPRMDRIDNRPVFFPESDNDVLTSLDFAINTMDPDYLSMNILRLLPGVPFSFSPNFACVRPTGVEPIHGGYYDSTWYAQNDKEDRRSTHPIFRAFEGCRSINPPQMTPQRCYNILSLAVEMVNNKNSQAGKKQTVITVDPRFLHFLKEEWVRGSRRYTLARLSEMETDADELKSERDQVLTHEELVHC